MGLNNKTKMEKVVNDLYLFYRVFVGSKFNDNLHAPHIKTLSRELMRMYNDEYHRLCVAMPPRHKLANSTPVLTTDGWKNHGDLKIGDYVYGLDGKPTEIIGVSGESLCDKLVTFSNGYQILAHSGHLWTIQKNKELIIIPTSKLKPNDYLPKVDYKELENQTNLKIHNQRIFVKNIETVNGELGKCIEITNDDGVYLVGKELIPTHNSKSSMITLAYPLWLIFRNPNLNILIINNSGSLSEKFGIQLREYVKEYGEYFNVHLSDVKKSQSYLMFSDHDGKMYNGSIRLIGKGGAITGTDADVIIIDDPYKGNADDLTPSALEKTIDWYNTIVEQRIEPQTRICILHTRWNSYDLQGYLKENDKESYKFIEFPAILEDNTPLWKERYTIQELEKKRERMGYRMFESIYQQKPLDDTSDFFEINKIKWYTPDIDVVTTVRAWDIAAASEIEEGKDFSSGAKVSLLSDNSILISDIVYGKFGNDIKNVIYNTCEVDGMDVKVIIETGIAAAGKLLFKEWSDQLRPYIVEQAMPVSSKEDRATPFKNLVMDGKVYVDLQNDDVKKSFKKEVSSFPNGVHDDIIDSIAHGVNMVLRSDKITPDLLFIDL